jgi:hypothetical protein
MELSKMKKKIKWGTLFFALYVVLLGGNRVYAANDSFTNAKSIGVNQNVKENLASCNDKNYYKFSISQNGYVTLNFQHKEMESTSAFWYVELYDKDRQVIKKMWVDGSISNTDSCNVGLPAGEYYVTVEDSVSYSSQQYQLKVAFTASEQWESEFNDGFLTADNITVNNTEYGALMDSSDDDYYKFALSQNGYITLNFQHEEMESSDSYWYVELYDKDRQVIKKMWVRGSISNTDSCNIGLPAGEYYVKVVDSVRYSSQQYQLKVAFKASEQWESEFNDGFLTADNITLNNTMSGSLMDSNDVDYYSLNLTSSGNVQLNFSHSKLEKDSSYWTVYFYDENRNELYSHQIQGNKKNTILKLGYQTSGKYYLKVSSGTYYSNVNYSIKAIRTYNISKVNISKVSSSASKKLTVKWKKISGVSGYEIVVATDKKFKKNKKVTIVNSAKKNKTTIKKLKHKKTYYVKIRGYVMVDGVKYYGKYSKVKKVKVR